ncbi:MAG: hypothetical protein P4L03_00350 [Terracidiphilus sp.]|nr:hypothetical protein [Terracidiphilus sp.]
MVYSDSGNALAASHAACTQSAKPTQNWTIGRAAVQFSGSLTGTSAILPPLTKVITVDPNGDIGIVNRSGARPRKIADGLFPALSPDGGMVAFCAQPPGEHFTQIMLVKVNGKAIKRLTNLNGSSCSPDWSPDGHKIAFYTLQGNVTHVMILDFDRKAITPVALGMLPRFSPDGKQLVFVRGHDAASPMQSIWVSDADGTHTRKVADTDSLFPTASWSGDGASIVYSRDDHHRSAIFRVRLDGSAPEELARDKDLEMYLPSISPDGKQLVVVADNGVFRAVQLIDLDTHKSRQIAYGSRASFRWVRSN